MAVHYEVPAGQTLAVAGPANVTIKGGEMPVISGSMAEVDAIKPVVTSLTPDSAESGSPDLTLVIAGTNFTPQSVIVFGTLDEPTTLTPAGELTTGVKPSLFAPAAVPVSVRNGPLRSDPLDFTFTEPGGATGASRRRR